MIRHYEKIGLIPPPPRRAGGYRDYSEPDVHRLRFIANARDLGFPTEQIGTPLALWADGTRARSEAKALAATRPAEPGPQPHALPPLQPPFLHLAPPHHRHHPHTPPPAHR